jgi:FtsH-binding integral membrane protein
MAHAYHSPVQPVITLGEDERATFITRVYGHLAAATAMFVALELAFFMSGFAETIYDFVAGTSWLLILGGFMVGSWLATNAAHDVLNVQKQYAGLVGMVVVYALLFAPLLYVADETAPGTIASAAAVTIAGFAGLTVVAFTTRRSFEFLGKYLMFGGIMALVAIVAAVLFNFELGVWFSVAMIAFAGAAILYKTQQIVRSYPDTAYVGAAVQLFASVMLLFWYVLRLFLGRR